MAEHGIEVVSWCLGQLSPAGVFESAISTWHAFFLSSIGNGSDKPLETRDVSVVDADCLGNWAGMKDEGEMGVEAIKVWLDNLIQRLLINWVHELSS